MSIRRFIKKVKNLHSQEGMNTSDLDLSVINLIRDVPIEDLHDKSAIEKILLSMGLNDEISDEFPKELYPYSGFGLFSWQYPSQFSGLLLAISKLDIKSYIEIGVRHGGTFIIISEYLKRLNPEFNKSIAVDLNESKSLRAYADSCSEVKFMIENSLTNKFRDFIQESEGFDLAFIDGDHSYEGARSDFETMRNQAKHIIFHDIVSVVCPGVCTMWQHVKARYADEYDFYEFIDQYDEVVERTGNTYLGIGLAVKKL